MVERKLEKGGSRTQASNRVFSNSPMGQKSTAAVLMEASAHSQKEKGLAMIQNLSEPVTILSAFLPNSLLQLHIATTPP